MGRMRSDVCARCGRIRWSAASPCPGCGAPPNLVNSDPPTNLARTEPSTPGPRRAIEVSWRPLDRPTGLRRQRVYELIGVLAVIIMVTAAAIYLERPSNPASDGGLRVQVVAPIGTQINLTAHPNDFYTFTVNESGMLKGAFVIVGGQATVLVCTYAECASGAVYRGPSNTLYESGVVSNGTLAVAINGSGTYGYAAFPQWPNNLPTPTIWFKWSSAAEFLY